MKDLVAIIPVSSFNKSKTRLSPFLTPNERIKLLKVMLKDIITTIANEVDEIVLVSKDENVKNFAKELQVNFVKEKDHENDFLNNAVSDAIEEVKVNFPDKDILILPSDIPLLKAEHISTLRHMDNDFIISPSKGGGTNLLCFNEQIDYKTQFGPMSYFKHLDHANQLGMSINILESFYVSLDMNTPEDLGELLLHGYGTYTHEFLSSINIVVKSSHGKERLDVQRKNEK